MIHTNHPRAQQSVSQSVTHTYTQTQTEIERWLPCLQAADGLGVDPLQVSPVAVVLDGRVVAPDARLLGWADTQHRRQLGATLELKAIRTRMQSRCEVLGDALVAARLVAKGAPEVSRVRMGDDGHVAVRIENATGAVGVARGILDPAGEGALGVALAAVGCQLVAEAAPVLGRAGLLCGAWCPTESCGGPCRKRCRWRTDTEHTDCPQPHSPVWRNSSVARGGMAWRICRRDARSRVGTRGGGPLGWDRNHSWPLRGAHNRPPGEPAHTPPHRTGKSSLFLSLQTGDH